MKTAGRLVAVKRSADFSDADRASVRAFAREVASRKITCNAIAAGAVEPEEIAEIAVFLCMRVAAAISGETIGVGVFV